MRIPVNDKQNLWFNGQEVDNDNLTLEQHYNNTIQSSTINNHFGTGVLLEDLTQTVLFDSSVATGLLDGKALDIQTQPTDVNYGNQLEIELTNAEVAGKRAIKVFIIGLDFENNLQYDTFIFHKNEKQFSSKHYINILTVLFNDFIGDPNQSLNLGGQIIIREAKPLSLSRDCIMVAQDVQPNVMLRDFFVASGTLGGVLTAALPNYNTDSLDIATDYLQLRELEEDDVSSQIGQKFQATSNNIQKITLLLAVSNSINPADLEWTGDLIVSIFQLQSSLDCPLDIAPGTAIEFDPSNIPLAQLSLSYNTLLASGFELNETPQPIDFIFSNTPVGAGSVIKSGSYYVVTVKRAGSADTCVMQFATGTNRLDNSNLTIFNGTIWVDVSEEDLWFQIWTDSAKVSDGQAYDTGHGIIVPKTILNTSTGVTEDYTLTDLSFIRNDVYYGVVEAITENSELVQDQRTGENVQSQQRLVPQISLLTSSQLSDIESVANPLVIGNISDKNAKSINAGTLNVTAPFHHFSMIKNKCIMKVIDDPSDSRYDLDIMNLITELTGGNGISGLNALINGKFTPNLLDPSITYRIVDTEVISMTYGDLNGDGIVDSDDLTILESLANSDLNEIPSYDNYITLTTLFTDDTGLTWELLDDNGITVLQSGTDGVLTADETFASFVSATATFNSVSSISTKTLRISDDISNLGNNGTFTIVGLTSDTTITIQKTYYTSDTILQILCGDINGDMLIDSTDIALVINYVNKVAPFPAVSSPDNKIGTRFTAIRFTLEQYIDRSDDYIASVNRSIDLHPLPDMLLDGYTDGVLSLFDTNLTLSPTNFQITKQLKWYDYFVNTTSNPKLVPVSFNSQSGYVQNDCELDGWVDDRYPLPPSFDPGKNNIFIPNDFVINHGGEIVRPDGNFMKIDFEVGTVVMEIPAISFSSEKIINIFTDFVADFDGSGHTRLGFECMKFADCSTVGLDALTQEQVRFSASIRSFAQEIYGDDDNANDGYIDTIMDISIGMYLNSSTGIMTLNFINVYDSAVLQTLKTRIQIIVYLKKAGFNNRVLNVTALQLQNLLEL